MVNVTALVVTPELVLEAFAYRAEFVIWMLLTTVVLLTVTSAPLTLTVAPVKKHVPVRVTPTVCP